MPDLNRVIDLHKVERRRLGLAVPADAAAENYDDEWLPDYEVIKTCLEATYETLRQKITCQITANTRMLVLLTEKSIGRSVRTVQQALW